mmetsp:Transcript_71395/g.220474  ORF Transcript_71395/g.220474 Transcript_71395/m.220474 type:complete len:352 (-) Transcript_71395:67-1122(-)
MGQQCAGGATVPEEPTDSLPLASFDQSNDVEVGVAEAPVLARAPRQPWPAASVEALLEDGAVMIPHVLPAQAAAALREHLESKLAASLAAVASGAAREQDLFEPVTCRRARHFLSLGLEVPVVAAAVTQSLRALAPLLRGALECDEPLLADLAAIRSAEGAPPQPLHMDDNTSWSGPPVRMSAFVALQDVDELMGPTVFLPGTHASPEAQAAMQTGAGKARLLRRGAVRLGTMPAGAGTLHQTGVLHAGGANGSPRGRWLFHMSFVPDRLAIPALDYYAPMCKLGVHALGELERGAVRGQDEDETKRLSALWTSLLADEEIKSWKETFEYSLYLGRSRYRQGSWWSRPCGG